MAFMIVYAGLWTHRTDYVTVRPAPFSKLYNSNTQLTRESK